MADIIDSREYPLEKIRYVLRGLFEYPPNFPVFCRTILNEAFTKPFSRFHDETIGEFLQNKNSAVAAPRGHGKLISDNIPVLTIDGWKTHGSLREGDYVFSPSGKPVKVLAVSRKDNAEFLVHTRDGEVIRCHANHEWQVWDRNLKREVIVETKNMLGDWSREGNRSRYLLPLREALSFNYKSLPLDSYFMGLWLGDGSSTKPCITHSPGDIDSVNSIPYKISTSCVHKLTGVVTTYFSNQGIIQRIKKLGLFGNKHIPRMYLESSKRQRLELLAGLIDSDGYVDKGRGRIRFVNINKRLVDDVCELVRGLGMRPIVTQQIPHDNSKGIVGVHVCYTVQFNPIEDIPTRLKRKKIVRLPNRPRLGITKVVYNPNGEKGKCVQVDSDDGLYLVGKKLIPTHNSSLIGLGYTLWLIIYGKKHYIVYTSQNHTKSVQFLEPLRHEIKYNSILKMIYGELHLKAEYDPEARKDREDVFDIGATRLQALSFEKNIRGLKRGNQRPDLIILDDIEDDQRVLNPELRRKDRNKLNKQIIPSLDAETGEVKMIGTILHPESLLVDKLQIWDGKIYRACEFDENDQIIPDSILWPEMFTIERLLARLRDIGSVAFQSEYLNNPVDDTTALIKRAWVVSCYDPELSYEDTRQYKYDVKIQGVDFAFSDRVSADKSAFLTIGQWGDTVDLVDFYKKKGMSTLEQFDYIKYLSGLNEVADNALEENSIGDMKKHIGEYGFPYTLFYTGARDPEAKNKPEPLLKDKRFTVGKVQMVKRLAAFIERSYESLRQDGVRTFRIPYKTKKDQEIAHELTDELCSWALENGTKLIEVGIHPDSPIALALALERLHMERFEVHMGVLDT